MTTNDPEFCQRCKAELQPGRETCPNCGAWA